MAVARADLVSSTSTFTLCIQSQEIWETREMICYVMAMGKQRLGPHVVVGYGIKIFWPGLFITSRDHLVVPLFQSKSKCKNDFDLHENETACRTHFHMKGFALRLILKQRYKRTQKWPIG